MKKLLTGLLTAAMLTGPMAAGALADPGDQVRETSCRLQEKLGVDNVQDCDLE